MNRIAFFLLTGLLTALLNTALAQHYVTDADAIFHSTDGISVTTPDSANQINFRFRMQNRVEVEATGQPFRITRKAFLVRRLRLRSFGYLGTRKLTYNLQLGFTRGDADIENSGFTNILRDAIVRYEPLPGFQVGLGLTKLPGNRQRIISSGEQQFVDRSIANATFNIDRDAGVFLSYESPSHQPVPYNLYATFSTGRGRNFDIDNAGAAYTGRIEILPLGDFTEEGDYFEGDWIREPAPKLSLAAAYSWNEDAVRTGGQIGDSLYSSRDMGTWITDVMLKYRGFALYGEFIRRTANDPLTYNGTGAVRYVYRGTGTNVQASYMLPTHWEMGIRYAAIRPDQVISAVAPAVTQYVVVVTKYFRWHRVKLQSDLTYQDGEYTESVLPFPDGWLWRFQVEIGI